MVNELGYISLLICCDADHIAVIFDYFLPIFELSMCKFGAGIYPWLTRFGWEALVAFWFLSLFFDIGCIQGDYSSFKKFIKSSLNAVAAVSSKASPCWAVAKEG